MNDVLTVERARELLSYDAELGILYWRVDRNGGADRAGLGRVVERMVMTPDDDSWLDTGMLFGAAVVALAILGVVELCRLPERLWRSIK